MMETDPMNKHGKAENGKAVGYNKPKYKCSRMANGLIRCGIAKNEHNANYLLLGLVVLNIAISIFIIIAAS